jgi:hypothetical protein
MSEGEMLMMNTTDWPAKAGLTAHFVCREPGPDAGVAA